MTSWPGRATAEGTSAYVSRLRSGATSHGTLGTTGLQCGRLGVGGARLHDQVRAHGDAVRLALTSGCNLIDTAGTYADGHSELALADVLDDVFREGILAREQVIVVGKVGRIRGRAGARLPQPNDPRAFPDVVRSEQGGPYSIHPDWLRSELHLSRERLRVSALDAVLLEQPEYYLRHGTAEVEDLEARRAELYARVEKAFAFLEGEVQAGRLGCYGVFSETFASSPHDPECVSVDRLMAAARRAGGPDHHFRVLQLPVNVMESGAFLERNGDPLRAESVLETAQRLGLAVLACRPLDAMVGIRLVDSLPEERRVDYHEQLRRLAVLEGEFYGSPLSALPIAVRSLDLFTLSSALDAAPETIVGPRGCDVFEHRAMHRLQDAFGFVDRYMIASQRPAWSRWQARYESELQQLLEELRRLARDRARPRAEAIHSELDRHLPSGARALTLSYKALWIVLSTPGVSCVPAGMRQVRHVREALAAVAAPGLSNVAPLYESLRALRAGPTWARLKASAQVAPTAPEPAGPDA